MSSKSKLGTGVAVLGLLALPVVSLFGGSLTAHAAEALPAAKGGTITLDASKTYDGFTLQANTNLVGNGAKITGPVIIAGSNVTIDSVKMDGDTDPDSKVTTPNSKSGITIANKVSNVKVTKSEISNFNRGVSADSGSNSNIHVIGNTFSGNVDNDVIVVSDGGDTFEITGNHGTKPLQVRGKTNDKRVTGVKIEGNTVNVKNNDTAIMNAFSNGANITDNIVKAANSTNALVSLSGANDITFGGNTITGGRFGVSVTMNLLGKGHGDFGSVKNIKFTDGNKITGSEKFGVRLSGFDGATFTGSNTIQSAGDALLIASASDGMDATNRGVLSIGAGTNLEGAKAIAFDPSAKFDNKTSKFLIDTKAVFNGKSGEKELAKQIDLTGVTGLNVQYVTTPTNPTTPEDKPVTKPNDDKKADNKVAAPNTGAQNIMVAVVTSAIVAAIAGGAAIATRKANR